MHFDIVWKDSLFSSFCVSVGKKVFTQSLNTFITDTEGGSVHYSNI